MSTIVHSNLGGSNKLMETVKMQVRRMIRTIGYLVRRGYYFALMKVIGAFTKVNDTKVLLSNFFGKGFGGNPRAIAEEIHKKRPELRLIWLSLNQQIDDSLPDYITPIRPLSLRYMYELTTSAVWVFNQPIDRGIQKKKKQLYIQTLHGDRALKKVYYQNIGKKKSDFKHAVSDNILDYGIAGSTSGETIFTEGLGYKGKLLKVGCPRNDCLVNPDKERVLHIKQMLGIEQTTNILLFAPTFRQGKSNLETTIDFNQLLDLLERKTKTKWACILRAHFHTNTIKAINSESGRFIQASNYPDMADLLLISDVLITDYSSSSGDFCLTGRPIILYLDDINEYSRDLTISLGDSPYFIAKNQRELTELLSNMTSQIAQANDEKLKRFWGIYETGRATQVVTDTIIAHIDTLKK